MISSPDIIPTERATFFLTGSTFLHYPYFRTDEQKYIPLKRILGLTKAFKVSDLEYSIAMNHYHLKFSSASDALSSIKQYVHGGISRDYKKAFSVRYRMFWQSFRLIRVYSAEADAKITGYIIGNLLKHREINRFGDLYECPFTSYRAYADRNSRAQADALIREAIELEEDADGRVRFEGRGKMG